MAEELTYFGAGAISSEHCHPMAHAWKNPVALRSSIKWFLRLFCYGGPLAISVAQVCLTTMDMPSEWKPWFL